MKNSTIYKQICENYKSICLEKLKEFVAIDSVYSDETKDENNPFGKGVSSALKYVETLAKNDGFKVTNYDNMVVEIICGEGEKNLTIMAHADVVPVGTGWEHDPFDMIEKDGILYARGVADDKGPLLAAYYALKALRDNNMLGEYQVRFLVGGNEERGSLCMEHYFHTLKKPQPTLGFSPDSDFPLIFAEKGIINFEVKHHFEIPHVISISGGVASNSVIEKCVVKMAKDDSFISYLSTNKIDVSVSNDGSEIIFHGLAAHGSTPWCGDNAAMKAFKALGEFYNNNELKHLVKCYGPLKGEGLKADAYSEDMFDNSLNVGIVNYENKEFTMIVNFRHVETVKPEDMINAIQTNSLPFKAEVMGVSPLLYYPKDSLLVSTLLSSYQEETGDYKTAPVSTGGGTYAKEADNVVAFGMQFPGRDAKMHGVGENLSIDDLFISMAIYARAIVDLGKKL